MSIYEDKCTYQFSPYKLSYGFFYRVWYIWPMALSNCTIIRPHKASLLVTDNTATRLIPVKAVCGDNFSTTATSLTFMPCQVASQNYNQTQGDKDHDCHHSTNESMIWAMWSKGIGICRERERREREREGEREGGGRGRGRKKRGERREERKWQRRTGERERDREEGGKGRVSP